MAGTHRFPSVMFVCTANICRSPMAEALFKARLRNERPDWQRWRVTSAGTWATDGEPASKNACRVMADHGLDISNHSAKTVTAELMKGFDLILTMETGHKEALQVEFPESASKVFLLSEMVGQAASIEDPYGRSTEDYEKTAQKIDQILTKGMPRILMLAAGEDSNITIE